jgi:hypothetical protein
MFAFSLQSPQKVQAAGSNTVNFQARLQTASGAIVPDDTYNVQFKLYSGSACAPATGTGCTQEWTESYQNDASNGVQVINGYLTVNLGSVTAFPTTLDWDQPLYLSMNIGGTTTGTPTYDGEMKPYLKLTAVPYAFQAKSASQLQQLQGSYTGTLNFATLTDNRTISLPDANGTVCLQNAADCGFLNETTADGRYLQNTATVQTGNIYLQAATSGSVAATFQAYASGTGDILDLLDGNSAAVLSVSNAGDVIIKPSDTSLTAFQIQNSTKTIFDVDTTNGRVGINMTDPSYALDVNGDINSTTAVRVGGVAVCTVSNCVPTSGSNNYVQNTTGTQDGANINIRSVASNAVTAVLQGASGQTADILQVEGWDGTSTSLFASISNTGVLTANGGIQASAKGTSDLLDLSNNGGVNVLSVSNAGDIIIKPSDASLTGFQIQNSSKTIFDVDTTNGRVGINTTSPGSALDVQGDFNFSGYLLQAGQVVLNTTTATNNIFLGSGAGNTTTTGTGNTAVGSNALHNTTTGGNNLAIGLNALQSDKTGYDNVALGPFALNANIGGNYNFALGAYALRAATGNYNVGIGASSLWSTTGGSNNLGIGYQALYTNTTGSNNMALGYNADVASGALQNATAIGAYAVVGQSNSIVLGGTGTYAVKVGIGTTTPGHTLDVVGDINTSTGYDYNGTAGATTTCAGGQFLQNQIVQGGIVTGGTCAAASAGITSVGTYSSTNTNTKGATISGSQIIFQSASINAPGMVDTQAQTFAGDKTFNGTVTFNGMVEATGQLLVDSALITPTVVVDTIDSNVTNTINIGQTIGGTATSINLNQSTTIASDKNLTITSGNLNVNGTPTASATSSLVRIGNAIQGGNSNGTYLGLNAASGYSGDLMNLQLGGSSLLQMSSDGTLKIDGGSSNFGYTFDTAQATFGSDAVFNGYATFNQTAYMQGGIDTLSAANIIIGGEGGAATGINLSLNTTVAAGKTITIGDSTSGNYITVSNTGLTAYGTARHTKTILLPAEYSGAALDAANDTSCASANSGNMASGFDSTSRQNFYSWTANVTGTECYDVVVQVPIPSDFAAWSAAPTLYVANTASSSTAVCVEAITTGGSIDANYGGYACATTGSSLSLATLPSLNGTYTGGGYMTFKIRLSSTSAANTTKIGNLTLQYYSKF